MSALTLSLDGETGIVVRRSFRAAPQDLFRAHTQPDLICQWMLGPPGWDMTQCLSDPVPGGLIRFDWQDADGNGFYLTGEYVAVTPDTELRHVERFHMPAPTPDNHVTTRFAKAPNGGTDLSLQMQVPDAETRTAMLATGMEAGMEASYARIDPLFD